MHKQLQLSFVFLSVLLVACDPIAKQPPAQLLVTQETPTTWQFETFSCAFGCDSLLADALDQRKGQVLDFNSPQNGFDLLTQCNGKLTLQETAKTNTEVIKQLNETVSPSQEFTPENTGLTDLELTTAEAICQEEGNAETFTTFWVVSLTKDTMKVYFEGASFLNFKAVKKD